MLHFLENQTHEAIARTLGLSRTAVTYRVHQGVERMRKALRRRGVSIATAALLSVLGERLEAAAVPASLGSALGKLALSGAARPVMAVAGAGLLGGIVLMKTKAITLAAGCLLFLLLGVGAWKLLPSRRQAVEMAGVSVPAGTLLEEPSPPPRRGVAPGDAPSAVPEVLEGSAGTLRGKAYDSATGEPLALVDVTLEPATVSGKSRTARSGDGGGFVFDEVAPGTYKLGRPDFAPGLPRFRREMAKTVQLEAGRTTEVDLPVDFGLCVSGRVVDVDGLPVAGARVEGRDRSAGPSLEICDTDEEGAFMLCGFHETQELTLEAGKERRVVSAVAGPLLLRPPGLRGVTLTVRATGAIAGVVVDGGGRPLPGVCVHPQSESAPRQVLGAGNAYAAADGSFVVDGLACGPYVTLLLPPGEASYQRAAGRGDKFQLESGGRIEGMMLVLEARRGRIISGRVTGADGHPVENAEIRLLTRQGPAGVHSRSDAAGLFTASGLEEESYTLEINHPLHAGITLEDVLGGTTGLEVALGRRGAIEGRLVDAGTGEPLGDFEVLHLDDYNRHFEGVRRDFRSFHNAGGLFRIEQVEPGPVTLVAKGPGHGEASLEVERIGAGETVSGLELRLPAAASVEGLVVDGRGLPVAGALIVPGTLPADENPALAASARTDAKGAFLLTDVSGDSDLISAVHPDFATGSSPVKLAAGGKARVRIVLPQGGTLAGTVRHDEVPWAGQDVRCRGSDGRNRELTTDAAGAFCFEKLPPGPVTVWVLAWLRLEEPTRERRYLAGRAVLEDGRLAELELRFRAPSLTVEGKATRDEKPVSARATLYLQASPGQELRWARIGEDGEFRFEGVPSGPAVLRLEDSRQGLFRRFERELPSGAPSGVVMRWDVDLGPGLAIVGSLSGAKPEDTVEILVYQGVLEVGPGGPLEAARSRGHLQAGWAELRGPGPYRIEGLEAGSYTVIAVSRELRPGPGLDSAVRVAVESVELRPGEDRRTDLTLEASVR